MTDGDDRKASVAAIFDAAASSYDSRPLRFFDVHAERLVAAAGVAEGDRVLDVASGTGKVAIVAARAAGTSGRVTGIDLSAGMLAAARRKAARLAITFRQMDAEALEFDDGSFDIVLCGFGIFFLPDMVRGMREMHRVLRPGGRVAFTTWTRESMEPMTRMLLDRLAPYGVARSAPPQPWMALTEPGHLLTLLELGGFRDGRVAAAPLGYPLEHAEEWWTIIEGSAMRRRVERVPAGELQAFRRAHLDDVERLRTADGLWLDASALIGIASREHASTV